MPSHSVPPLTEQRQVESVTVRLVDQFTELQPAEVQAAVACALTRFEQARLRQFVPLLVERDAKAECRRRIIDLRE